MLPVWDIRGRPGWRDRPGVSDNRTRPNFRSAPAPASRTSQEATVPSRILDFPVFDADNHMYETPDALTKFLDEPYKGVIKYIEVERPHQDHGEGHDQRVHPEPDVQRRGRARRAGGVLQERQPRGQVAAARSWARPIRSPEAFFAPEPRVKLMDELGIDRAMMWPTLASLVEERLRDDPYATHAVINALNRVDARAVDVQLRGPHLRHAGHHPAHRRQRDRGARVGARARRQGRS